MKESSLGRLFHVAHVLEARLEQDLAGAGLSVAKLNVLGALADGPLPLGEVAARCGACART